LEDVAHDDNFLTNEDFAPDDDDFSPITDDVDSSGASAFCYCLS
jgi:ABC-type branched-subunit amino acid transport system substrate-binding protein